MDYAMVPLPSGLCDGTYKFLNPTQPIGYNSLSFTKSDKLINKYNMSTRRSTKQASKQLE